MFENIVVPFKEPIPELRPFIVATRLLHRIHVDTKLFRLCVSRRRNVSLTADVEMTFICTCMKDSRIL